MNIIRQILKVLFVSILLLLVLVILRKPGAKYNGAGADYVYSAGNAPSLIRSQITAQLQKFQDGYTLRDTDRVQPFMDELFSKENILVLGTMPDEVYTDHEAVSDLIYSDWNAWGDCTFLIENAHISTAGDAAWISTVGLVEFDLSRFLVLPLRLSAVMVEEDDAWKFQFMQFQFDLTLIPLILAVPLLIVGFAVSVGNLIVVTVRDVRKDQP